MLILLAGWAIVPAAVLAVAGGAVALLGLVLCARWPAAIWLIALTAVLLAYAPMRSSSTALGPFSLYLTDLAIPYLGVAALLGGIAGFPEDRLGRIAYWAGVAFLGVVFAWAAYAILGPGSGAVQTRQLAPLVLVPVLGVSRVMVRVRPIALANVAALALAALAVRSLVLLASGSETEGARKIGVQRIFQTWEPFVAAALVLLLLAYVLFSDDSTRAHLAGIAAGTVPVLFSFFRTTWILLVVLAVAMILMARPSGRRLRTLAMGAAALVIGVAFLSLAQELTGRGGKSYGAQLAGRAGKVTPILDKYRSSELGAVWEEIGDSPRSVVIGSGFGTKYSGVAPSYRRYPTWAHNAYEWTWWRLGVVGLVILLTFLGAALGVGWRLSQGPDPAMAAAAMGIVAGLAFIILAANLHENFESYQSNMFVALAVGQLLAWNRLRRGPAG